MNESTIGEGCTFKAETLNMGNYAKVDTKSVISAVMDSKFQQDVQTAIQQAAESAAKAGIGISASESDAITRSITTISTSVTNSVRSIVQTDVSQHNIFSCAGQDANVDIVLFDMNNDAKTLSQQITSSSEVTTAEQTAVTDIAQEIKSLASGLDPTALVGIILAIFLLVGGGAFFGVNKVVNLLTSAQFWFIVSLVGTVGGAGISLLRIGNGAVWPYETDNKTKNNSVLIVSLVVGGISAAAMAITGYMISSGGKGPLASAKGNISI